MLVHFDKMSNVPCHAPEGGFVGEVGDVRPALAFGGPVVDRETREGETVGPIPVPVPVIRGRDGDGVFEGFGFGGPELEEEEGSGALIVLRVVTEVWSWGTWT